MVFGVATLVHHLSQYLVLEPGDLLNTGTPQGVALSGRFPYLSVGDVMEIEIDGLGGQRSVLAKAGSRKERGVHAGGFDGDVSHRHVLPGHREGGRAPARAA